MNDQPWPSSLAEAFRYTGNLPRMSEVDAYLFGARILAQVFMESVNGNYSSNTDHMRKVIKKNGKGQSVFSCSDLKLKATGVTEKGNYLVFSQSRYSGYWLAQ